MIKYNPFKNLFKKPIKTARNAFLKYFPNQISLCRIEKIDLQKGTIYIHCRGIDAPLKFKFHQIAADEAILSNLSSQHASWVGYYCGKFYLSSKNKFLNPQSNFTNTNKRYQVIAHNRNGDIDFLDKETNTLYNKNPREILTQKTLIAQFSGINAYYIGFLYGIKISKNQNNKKAPPNISKPLLKLLKS